MSNNHERAILLKKIFFSCMKMHHLRGSLPKLILTHQRKTSCHIFKMSFFSKFFDDINELYKQVTCRWKDKILFWNFQLPFWAAKSSGVCKNLPKVETLKCCTCWRPTLVGWKPSAEKVRKSGLATCAHSKVIYTKYSKHWLYTVTHTIECVCSKINNSWFNPWFSFYFSSLYPAPHIEWYMC